MQASCGVVGVKALAAVAALGTLVAACTGGQQSTPASSRSPATRPAETALISPGTHVAAPPCHGLWREVPSPDSGEGPSLLEAVSADASTDAWAVGGSGAKYSLETRRTLVEHWDGRGWTIVPSPSPGAVRNELTGVSAVSPQDVWAVGDFANMTRSGTERGRYSYSPLIEHWDGASWTVIPSPDPHPETDNFLNAVVAVSPRDAWAVGGTGDIRPNRGDAFILHWDGHRWTTWPIALGHPSGLDRVVATSPSDVWASGYGLYALLVEHFDGLRWRAVQPPPRRSTPMPPSGSVADVWVIERHSLDYWNGSSWGAVPPPQLTIAASPLGTPRDLWAIGYAQSGFEGGGNYAQAWHWNGTRWSMAFSLPGPVVTTPPSGPWTPPDELLFAAAAAPTGEMWAVGRNGGRTLVIHLACG